MSRVVDRGIGGTGSPTSTTRLADRGIGGTGIVAVITGFASICLGGQEVALDPAASVQIDERAAKTSELRAGQVAVVEATGTAGSLRTRRVVVRHEVTGQLDAVDGEMLRVAGQPVAWMPATWGDVPAAGDWVAVSGLRRADGVIEATRIDPAPAGPVMVRGLLVRDLNITRIGLLPVSQSQNLIEPDGYVTVTGMMAGGVLRAAQIVPDLLASDPSALFNPDVNTFFIEAFVMTGGNFVRFGQGFSAAAPSFAAMGPRRAVIALERGGAGLRTIYSEPERGSSVPGARGRPGNSGSAQVPTHGFAPAPMPNRLFRAPTEQSSRSSNDARNGDRRQRINPRAGPDGATAPGDVPSGGAGPALRLR